MPQYEKLRRHLRLQDERDLVEVLAPKRPLELRWCIGLMEAVCS